MEFNKHEIILEDDRARIRPLVSADMEHLLPFSLNEPELWTYSLQQGGGEENLRSYIEQAIADRNTGNAYPFIIWDKKLGEYAGSTRFYDIQLHHRTLMLGYTWYGKRFQGTGLNKHCKYLMLEFAFERQNFERVEFRADANNARSIAAMKSIGCTEEGILRSNCISPTGRRDSIVMSILKEEWESDIRALLRSKLVN